MATQKFSDLTATTTPNAESVFAIAHSSSTTWTIEENTSEGYFETEDNLDLLVTENELLFQQEGAVVIAPNDWQDVPDTATTTWTIQ